MGLRNTILPSIMITSVLSFSTVLVYKPSARSRILMRYSPSAGKSCLKRTPPRVPGGNGSSLFWFAAMEYVTFANMARRDRQ